MIRNNNEMRDPRRLIIRVLGLCLISSLIIFAPLCIHLAIQLNKEHDNYIDLLNDYDTLYDDYQELLDDYNSTCSIIKQQILPVQFGFFAEAVRRHYMPQYLDGKTGKTLTTSFAEFCRDIILHDSGQKNSFIDVSNAYSDALIYGADTMHLCYTIMSDTFYDWLPNWEGFGLIGNELVDINTIHQWCIDEIEYEYDEDITIEQEAFNQDYVKFSVETAFRTMGDCEDQAILEAAYLESCGFEIGIAFIHDPSHPTYGEFYHSATIVHLEDTISFKSSYPSCSLWSFGPLDPYYPDYTWCFLDPTWDVSFGNEPLWLQSYGSGMNSDICTIAFCDIGGFIL